ncbi:MAG: hypothetical protein LBJ73_00255 [Rickettsiales bacterium]|nr:hypothetical protein [Rickettsiales bacterium]
MGKILLLLIIAAFASIGSSPSHAVQSYQSIAACTNAGGVVYDGCMCKVAKTTTNYGVITTSTECGTIAGLACI